MDSTQREIKKYTNLAPDEIKVYINKFRKAVLGDKYSIAKNENREENSSFIEDYRIDTKKEKEILLNIEYDDFCYAVDNENDKFAYERLYIFCKCQELDYWGTLENIDIYIKINMIQTRRGDDYVIVVSFHKKNKPIQYLFK